MPYILGISAGFHDAAASVVDSNTGDIVFAAHSERYSKKKNDATLHKDLLAQCFKHTPIETIAFYERPWMHNVQQFRSGQAAYGPWTVHGALRKYLGASYKNIAAKEVAFPHHLSHAASGFQTSPFASATVVVIDAIGELDTVSIYRAQYNKKTGDAEYKKLWGQRYPDSIGLFYSAVTDYIGLKPMEDEYITMGMAAYGSTHALPALENIAVADYTNIEFKENFHTGLPAGTLYNVDTYSIATAAQIIAEQYIINVTKRAKQLTGENNLVFAGGVALNCLANRLLGKYFDNIWIMPNPGDAGSSLGAAALAYKKKLNWQHPYLGYKITGEYPVSEALDELLTNKIVGVANGAAEFGPRALGNRSLLADPRGPEIKDAVNRIKKRQKFRPFAPVILEEFVDDYFVLPAGWKTSPYMQVISECKYPAEFPAIVHKDNTSRVQTVAPDCASGIRQLLEAWYKETGCPMLLNTSLNIRGEPVVNTRADAARFQRVYGVKVFT